MVVLDIGVSVRDNNEEAQGLGVLDECEFRSKSTLSPRVLFEAS